MTPDKKKKLAIFSVKHVRTLARKVLKILGIKKVFGSFYTHFITSLYEKSIRSEKQLKQTNDS